VLDPDKGGGYLLEAGIHHLDFALWLWGEPVEIRAVVGGMAPGSRVPDTLHAVLSFARGHRMVLNWCYGGPAGMGLLHMTEWVIGPAGLAQIDPVPGPLRYFPPAGEPETLAIGGPDPYQNEIDHFVQCVLEDRTPSVTGVDGRRALELHLALLRAGESAKGCRPPTL
jgi:predicted dehydrogenase